MAATETAKFIFESTFFPEVTEGDRVLSEPFLAASHVVVDFLGMLGKLFLPVKADVNSHIERVKKLVVPEAEKFRYLDAILDPAVEVDNKDKKKRNDAATSLTWLKRIMDFCYSFLSDFVREDKLTCEDLRPLFRNAYEVKLKKHHNVVAQKLFQVCVHAAPTRSSMINVLTGKGDRSEQQVYNIMGVFLVNMKSSVEALTRNFDRFGAQQ